MFPQIVKCIEEKNLFEGHTLIETALNLKADRMLLEYKKQVSAKSWPNRIVEDAQSIFNESLRKAFREKMLKLQEVS